MARPRYPSDEARVKSRPHVKVHLSVANHRKTAEAWANLEMRAMLVELWRIAAEKFAGRTGDEVVLTRADLASIAGRAQYAHNLRAVRALCALVSYEMRVQGALVLISLRKFAKKQGYNSADCGVTPPTPPPSDSDSEADSDKKKEEEEAPPAPRSRSKPKTDPPESLEGADWSRLVSRLWNSLPHLVAKDESPPAPHCSLRWVRAQTHACLDHFRGVGQQRPDWPATCSTWIHKSDAQEWSRLKRAPPARGEYHADPETFLPDVLRKPKEPDGPESPLDRDGLRAAPRLTPPAPEPLSAAGAQPALRLADSRP